MAAKKRKRRSSIDKFLGAHSKIPKRVIVAVPSRCHDGARSSRYGIQRLRDVGLKLA